MNGINFTEAHPFVRIYACLANVYTSGNDVIEIEDVERAPALELR
jgi:hypothetical protein